MIRKTENPEKTVKKIFRKRMKEKKTKEREKMLSYITKKIQKRQIKGENEKKENHENMKKSTEKS